MTISISKKSVGFPLPMRLTSMLGQFHLGPGFPGVPADILTPASILHGGEGHADFTSDIRPCCLSLLLKNPSLGEVGGYKQCLPSLHKTLDDRLMFKSAALHSGKPMSSLGLFTDHGGGVINKKRG